MFVCLVQVSVEKETGSDDVLGGSLGVFGTQTPKFALDVSGEFFSCDAFGDGRSTEAGPIVAFFRAVISASVVFEARFAVPLLTAVTITALAIPRTPVTATLTVPLLGTLTIAAFAFPGTPVTAAALALRSRVAALKAAAAVRTAAAALPVV